jgi:hypothetical protein
MNPFERNLAEIEIATVAPRDNHRRPFAFTNFTKSSREPHLAVSMLTVNFSSTWKLCALMTN